MNYILIIVVFLFMAAGLVYTLQQQLSEPFSQAPMAFHDCLYFVIVSFSTVGYGDIYAVSYETRLMMAAMLPIMVIVFPVVGVSIYDLFQAQSRPSANTLIATGAACTYLSLVPYHLLSDLFDLA